MIKVYAEIKIIEPKIGQSIISAEIIPSGYNNISYSRPSIPINMQYLALNPFIIGASRIGDGSTLCGAVGYFIGNQLSQEDGTFAEPYTITLHFTDEEIDHFTIAFDTRNNRHPSKIVVDGKTYIDDDARFVVTNIPKQSSHVIEISDWNSPKYPLVITGVYVGIQIDLDYRNMKSCGAVHKRKPEIAQPYYGILSNTGNLNFVDFDGEIKDYNTLQLLKSDLAVNIYLKDTLTKKETPLASFTTDDWNYDTQTRYVTVTLKDNLVELQKTHHPGIPLLIGDKTAKDLYIDLFLATPEKFNFKPFDSLAEKTRRKLSSTYIPYYYLKSGSLWVQWEKLCKLLQGCIYQDFDGNTIFEV